MLVSPVSVSLVILPLALINIAIGMNERALSISLVVLPLTIVLTAVLPHLLTVSILHTVQQLSGIDGTV